MWGEDGIMAVQVQLGIEFPDTEYCRKYCLLRTESRNKVGTAITVGHQVPTGLGSCCPSAIPSLCCGRVCPALAGATGSMAALLPVTRPSSSSHPCPYHPSPLCDPSA